MRAPSRVSMVVIVAFLTALGGMSATKFLVGAEPPVEKPPSEAKQVETKRAVEPKSLSDVTTKGLEYLVSQQHADGGWGQGGGWRTNSQGGGRVEGENVNDPSDLGNTCIATLALIRAGNTPQQGKYANQVDKAARFVLQQVDQSDNDSLYVTSVRDTQLQQKIGQYVDTFLAGLVLSELKGKMPAADEPRLLAGLQKTIAKIERNQREDGTFAGNTGWASVLSLGLCSKLLNGAAQQKVAVKAEVLKRDYAQSVAALNGSAADVRTAAVGGRIASAKPTRPAIASSDAGVKLYGTASNAGRIGYFDVTNRQAEQEAQQTLARASATPAERAKAETDLKTAREVRASQRAAASEVVSNLGNKEFVAGFGNNGGEEFLSYMNISEMLIVQGGNEWQKWDKSVTANLERIQNQDGSWSGHHCITGRTFCTATALLTLMADRMTVPVAQDLKK